MVEQKLVDLISKTIDEMRDDIVKHTSEVVKIKSVNPSYLGVNYDDEIGGEKRCNEYIEKKLLKDMDCSIDFWEEEKGRANLASVFKGVGGGKSLILTAHVDTVPEGNLKVWKYPPFSGEIKNGKIYGRGASDCKAGLICSIYALKAIQRIGIKVKGDVIFASTVGEETGEGGAEGVKPLGAVSMVKRGYTADAAIFVEQYDGIWITQPHEFWLRITVEGKQAHGMFRYEVVHAGGRGSQIGVNAIDKGFKIYQALRELERQWGITKKHSMLPNGHFTIGANVIRAGPGEIQTPFIMPDKFQIDYCIWGHPEEPVERVKKEVENTINTVASADEWLKDHPPKIEWKLWWPPFSTSPDHPIVKTVSNAYKTVTGKEPVLSGCPGSLDTCFLEENGIPSISHGAGGAGTDTEHAENEFVEIKDLIRATKVLAISVLEWCEQSNS